MAEAAIGMKASEVGNWLRQHAGKRDHREAVSGDDRLVLRPGPNFDQLLDLLGTSARARLAAPSSLSHEIPDRNSHCQKNEDDPPPVSGIGPAARGRPR